MEKKCELHEQAWCKGLFEQCFDPEFQANAVHLVMQDQASGEYKYFAKMLADGLPLDLIVNSEPMLVMRAADAHGAIDWQESPETDVQCPLGQLVDREEKPIEIESTGATLYGIMTKWTNQKKSFTVKYYKDIVNQKCAAKMEEKTHAEVLTLLRYDVAQGPLFMAS